MGVRGRAALGEKPLSTVLWIGHRIDIDHGPTVVGNVAKANRNPGVLENDASLRLRDPNICRRPPAAQLPQPLLTRNPSAKDAQVKRDQPVDVSLRCWAKRPRMKSRRHARSIAHTRPQIQRSDRAMRKSACGPPGSWWTFEALVLPPGSASSDPSLESRPAGVLRRRDIDAAERSGTAKAFLRAANGLASRGTERLWNSACGFAGTMAAPHMYRTWSSSGRERVVVVAPHPDDEAVGCVGTMLRHGHLGDRVTSIFVTDGSRSRAFGIDREEMITRRKTEATEAAIRMGATHRWLGLREGEWSDEDGRRAITQALLETAPTVVYAPSTIDYHPEHRRVARILAASLTELRWAAEIRIFSIQVPLTPLLANLIHDVSDLDSQIRSVLACYASQRDSLGATRRLRGYAARFYGARRQVEAFRSVLPVDYRLLIARRLATFRPLMIRSWSDPLSLLVGLPERLSWRKLGSVGRSADGGPSSLPGGGSSS